MYIIPSLESYVLCDENAVCLSFKQKSGQLLANNGLVLVRTPGNMVRITVHFM